MTDDLILLILLILIAVVNTISLVLGIRDYRRNRG
jgi:hypothetical protein